MYAVQRILAKHRQARMHLEAFHKAVKAFIGQEPYRIAGEFNSDFTEYVYRAYDIQDVPEEISLLAGDVIHNTRACLDHLAWEIARAPDVNTTFPIWETRKNDKDPPISGGISPRHQDALVSAQPYTKTPLSPGDDPLLILHRLDITDKHKVILASVSSIGGNLHGQPRDYHGSVPVWDYEWGPMKAGEPVARVRFSEPSPQMQVPFEIVPSVSLHNVGAAQRPEDARDILWAIHKEVESTVRAFEPL